MQPSIALRSRWTAAAHRAALVLAVAVVGAAALAVPGAAPQGSVVRADGPDAFIQLGHRTAPVFFCDPGKPNQQHTICVDTDGPRLS